MRSRLRGRSPSCELQAAVMGAETAFPVHHVPRKDEDGG